MFRSSNGQRPSHLARQYSRPYTYMTLRARRCPDARSYERILPHKLRGRQARAQVMLSTLCPGWFALPPWFLHPRI